MGGVREGAGGPGTGGEGAEGGVGVGGGEGRWAGSRVTRTSPLRARKAEAGRSCNGSRVRPAVRPWREVCRKAGQAMVERAREEEHRVRSRESS